MSKGRILIVDDEIKPRVLLARLLTGSGSGYEVVVCEKGSEVLSQLESKEFDLVISDIMMPEMNGLTLLKKIRKNHHDVLVIMVTAFGSIDSGIEATLAGAENYITKPYTEDQILITIGRAMEKKKILDENKRLCLKLERKFGTHNIVGADKQIKSVLKFIGKVTLNNANVLIEGETGTGKELVAKAIHYSGRRAGEAFVAVNLAAVPETLIESAIFGYSKGAFTGADKDTPGYFESANGGTLFLDEIGDLGQNMQVKLLRVLEDKSLKRVGCTIDIPINVRVISATNQDLKSMLATGKFRRDLYYRLNILSVTLPPLRERKNDIPLLVDYFLQKHRNLYKDDKTFSSNALKRMINYDWPGNVRELENKIIGMLVNSDDSTIEREELPPEISDFKLSIAVKDGTPKSFIALKENEKNYLIKVMAHVGGSQGEASEILGIHRTSLYRKLKKHSII